MARLTYTNERGQSLTFGDAAPLLVTKIDGLGSPQNEIYRQKSPYQDGTTVTHTALDERELVLEGVILASAQDRQKYRQVLLQTFNPKLKGTLVFERYGTKKQIECIPELAPSFPSNMQENYQQFLITLLCPSPFWQDLQEGKEEIALWVSDWEFPIEMFENGMEFGHRATTLIKNIINNGDVECGIRVEFRALSTVSNPSIFDFNSREFIKVKQDLVAGDKLIITTHFGNKRVELIKSDGTVENVFNYIDLDSTFLQLQPGDNLLQYDAEQGIDNLEVAIYHRPLYVGI